MMAFESDWLNFIPSMKPATPHQPVLEAPEKDFNDPPIVSEDSDGQAEDRAERITAKNFPTSSRERFSMTDEDTEAVLRVFRKLSAVVRV